MLTYGALHNRAYVDVPIVASTNGLSVRSQDMVGKSSRGALATQPWASLLSKHNNSYS